MNRRGDAPAPGPEHGAPPSNHRQPPAIADHEMLKLIGRGSYGEVWLARNALGVLRAVKVVYRHCFDSDRPYEREFNGIKKFEPVSRSHEGLVDVLHVGRNDRTGFFYYVMELADDARGETGKAGKWESENGSSTPAPMPTFSPASYIPRTLGSDARMRGRVPVAECLPIFLTLTAALGHLHKRELVHRDIKPANIIFVDGVAKLADIGLVADVGEAATYVGTEGFIPPEGPGTRQADLYSLGKVFYEISTGRDRLEFPSLPVALEDLSASRDLFELNAVITKACAGDPRQRYQTAEEMHAELALLQSGKSIQRLRLMEHRLQRGRRFIAVAAIVALVATGISLLARYQTRVQHENYERAEKLRLRAERAESAANDGLWRARVNEARALRNSGQAGRRFAALNALTNAASVRVDAELRSEAAAALAMSDIRPLPFGRDLERGAQQLYWWPRLERYSEADAGGQLTFRRPGDHAVMERLSRVLQGPGGLELIHPKGRWFITRPAGSQPQLWDVTHAISSPEPSFANAALTELRFANEHDWIVLGFANQQVEVRDLTRRTIRHAFRPGVVPFNVILSPDDRLALVTGRDEHAAELWDLASATRLRELDHPAAIYAAAWSGDGQNIASITRDHTIHLWNATTGESLGTLSGHESQILSLIFVPRTDWLLTASWDGTVRLWDARQRRELLRQPGRGCVLTLDPETLRFGSEDGDWSRLALFEIVRPLVLQEIVEPATGEQPLVAGADFSEDGRFLISTFNGRAHLWDVASGHVADQREVPGANEVHRVPGRNAVWLAGERGLFFLPIQAVSTNRAEFGEVDRQRPEGMQHFHRARDGTIAWMDGPNVHRVSPEGDEHSWAAGLSNFGYLALSPDARWVAGGTRNLRGIRVWNAQTGALVRQHPAEFGGAVAYSPDSRWLATGSSEEYCLYDAVTGNRQWAISREHTAGLAGRIAFSPDGTLLALAHTRSIIKIVRPGSGQEIIRLEAPKPEIVSTLRFSADNSHLAVCGEARTIQVWNLGRLRQELTALNFGWE